MSRRPRDRRLVTAAGIMVVALLAGACGGASEAPTDAASASPSAAVIATPAPTRTPIDISAAFLSRITAKDFKATEKVTGSVMVGSTKSVITGSGAQSGSDSRQVLTIKTGSTSQTLSNVSLGGTSWTKADPGPWIEVPKTTTPTRDFTAFLSTLTAVKDLDSEVRDGRSYHHLQPSGGNAIGAEYVGFGTGPNAKDAAFTIDFYATDDGTPVIIALAGTWTAVSGDAEVPASLTFEDALTNVGLPQTVDAPDDVWVRYTSTKLGYTMAHPADMKVTNDRTEDTFSRDGQGLVYVATTPYTGSTARFASALQVSYRKPFGGAPDSVTDRTLGGQAAVRLAYKSFDRSGAPAIVVDDVTTRAGVGWEVFIVTTGGDADVATFNQFAATFAFTK
jgi:hypothetical protein